MICPHCSAANPNQNGFCGNCGFKLLRPVAPVVEARRAGPWWLKLFVACTLVALGFMVSRSLAPLLAVPAAMLLAAGTVYLLVKKLGPQILRVGTLLVALGGLIGIPASFAHREQQEREAQLRHEAMQEAERQRQADLARVPTIVVEIKSRAASAAWEQAAASYSELARIDAAKAAELSSEHSAIQAGLAKLAEERRVAERKQQISKAIVSATKVVNDKKVWCNTPESIKEVWDVLKTVKPTDADYAAAKAITPKLEQCRKGTERRLTDEHRKLRRHQRQLFASTIDKHFLDNGLDVEVAVGGSNKDRLTLTNIMFSNRAVVHNLDKSAIEMIRGAGFKRVSFNDGFGGGQYFDLRPDPEYNAGPQVLSGMGLGEPLKL